MVGVPVLVAVVLGAVLLLLRADPADEESTALDSLVTTTGATRPEGSLPGSDEDDAGNADPPAEEAVPPAETSIPDREGSGSEEVAEEVETTPVREVQVEGCPAPDGSDGPKINFDGPQPMCIDPDARYTAVFDTSEGEMRFVLTPETTLGTVNNFVTLARWGYYDGTLLFRTDPSIDIIQGGSPHTNSPSDPGPGYNIPDEPAFDPDPDTGQPVGPYRYVPGQLVMARSAGFDSGGAQFFITTGPNAALLDSQGVYVVFGVTDQAGLDVALSIMDLHVPGGSLGGGPSRDVVVHAVTIEETYSTG